MSLVVLISGEIKHVSLVLLYYGTQLSVGGTSSDLKTGAIKELKMRLQPAH